MNKFSYKTSKKYIAPSFILGVILLIGLVSPAFVGASITVTGSGHVEEDTNDNWGIIVTGTSSVPTNSPSNNNTIITSSGSSHDDSSYTTTAQFQYKCTQCRNTTCSLRTSSTPCASTCRNNSDCQAPATAQAPCHDDSCTTTATQPICHDTSCTTTTTQPICHDTSCTTTTTQPICHDDSCTKYTCNSNYQCVVDSNGQYTSLGTCQNNCTAPIRYSCNTNTYQCYATTNGQYASSSTCNANCNAPTKYTCNSNYQCVVDSNGQYTSLGTCQNNCTAPIRYSCNTNTYQCYATTNGQYASSSTCNANCNAPTKYTCNSNYQCVVDSNGQYASSSTCNANCTAPIRYACNTNTYQCYQTTSGAYISYNDCANACKQIDQSLSVSCYTSPNPAQTNQTVTFSSNVSGGSGSYTYYWSGATYGNNSYSQKSFSSYGNYTAYLTVNDSQNRSASTSCSVNVNDQCTNTSTLSLWADNYTIAQGESTYLRWTSTHTNYCTASTGWSGSKLTSGYESVSPNANTTYSLTCYGSCGQITRSITIYTTSVSTSLNLTKLGRNLSTGNRVYSKVVRVTEGDVIEFYLTVTAGNNKDLYNVKIKDVMPSVISYMPGTTKINNVVQPDTITTTGLSLGTIYKGTSKTIVFQAISLYPGTYLTYTNIAEITADNESKITDSASITYGLVAGAATIRTGPLDTLFISFVISLISALMIWYYLKFNPKGQLALVRTESKIRDIWLAYTRNRIMRQN